MLSRFSQRDLLFGFWIVLSAIAALPLLIYEQTSAAAGDAKSVWVSECAFPLTNQATLVMFVHPKCSCSRASLHNLEQITRRTSGKANCIVVFVQPPGKNNSWSKSDLWTQAHAIPNVKVVIDTNAQGTSRFGVRTSGETLLYSSDGSLLFDGGLTIARGHEGDSPGAETLVNLINSRQPGNTVRMPIFGCGLFNDTQKVIGGS